MRRERGPIRRRSGTPASVDRASGRMNHRRCRGTVPFCRRGSAACSAHYRVWRERRWGALVEAFVLGYTVTLNSRENAVLFARQRLPASGAAHLAEPLGMGRVRTAGVNLGWHPRSAQPPTGLLTPTTLSTHRPNTVRNCGVSQDPRSTRPVSSTPRSCTSYRPRQCPRVK